MNMTDQEKRLREAIVSRVKTTYPDTGHDFSDFLAGKKVAIDSWLGDSFAFVLGDLRLHRDYDQFRTLLFID